MTKLKIGSRTGLYRFDVKDIRSWKPCYDPTKHLPEDWRGTAVDILKRKDIPASERLWACLRSKLVSEKTLRLFAVRSCRQVQHLIKDPCSIAAEQFALGVIAKEAWQKARYTAYAAISAVVAYAIISAYAAATISAVAAASTYAVFAYAAATYAAARERAKEAQIEKLIETLLAEGKERLAKKYECICE